MVADRNRTTAFWPWGDASGEATTASDTCGGKLGWQLSAAAVQGRGGQPGGQTARRAGRKATWGHASTALCAHLAAQVAQAGACALRQGHRRFHGRRAGRGWGRGQLCCQLGSRRLLLLLLSLHGGFRGSDSGDTGNGCCGEGLPHAAVGVEPGRRKERGMQAGRQAASTAPVRPYDSARWPAVGKFQLSEHNKLPTTIAALHDAVLCNGLWPLTCGWSRTAAGSRAPGCTATRGPPRCGHQSHRCRQTQGRGAGKQAGVTVSAGGGTDVPIICWAGTSMLISRGHAPSSHHAHLASMFSVATTAMVCCCTGGAAQALLRGHRPSEVAARGSSRAACEAKMGRGAMSGPH